jgi:pimeloyl-ACP methyl ester carboxylesterase
MSQPARPAWVDGAGHSIQEDASEEIVAAIRGWRPDV